MVGKAEMLLRKYAQTGGDPANARDANGWTALHLCAADFTGRQLHALLDIPDHLGFQRVTVIFEERGAPGHEQSRAADDRLRASRAGKSCPIAWTLALSQCILRLWEK